MNARFASLLLFAGLAIAAGAADEKDTKVTSHDALNARILEENAKNQAANPAAARATASNTDKSGKAASRAAKPDEKKAKTAATESASPAAAPQDEPRQLVAPKPDEGGSPTGDGGNAKANAEPATVLPKVEVSRGRINELDGKIIAQEKEIAAEKQNTKPTELDKALNNSKVSKVFSIFGGESSSQRATVANERVKIMEEERDILESMKAAKTKEEKADLQKQLDELRAYRRQLEKSLR